MRLHRARNFLASTIVLNAGCSFAHHDVRPVPGWAYVAIPAIDDAHVALRVYGINSRHRILSQRFDEAPKSLVVKPGTGVLDVDCFREGAVAIVDGSFDFEATFRADLTYVLDCAPSPNNANGFSLRLKE